MSTRSIAKQDTRTALLESGVQTMLEKGYTNTGIAEVLAASGIPKGSFYHFFDSKESFAIAIIQHYDQIHTAELLKILTNSKQTPLQRLKTYCETGTQKFLSEECRNGCLIGNLSQEMSDQSENLRNELLRLMMKSRKLFATCIAEGQKSGEITKSGSADRLAEVFSSGWAGALMRAKTFKTTEPMEAFYDLMLKNFFKS